MASECQKLAVRLFRRPEKAVQRNFFLEFSEIGSVNIIRNIGDIDGILLQNPKLCVVKGILSARPFSGPVLFRLAVKPTASIGRRQRTIDISKKEDTDLSIGGRHDPCIIPRAIPVIENAAALVILDLLLTDRRNSYVR